MQSLAVNGYAAADVEAALHAAKREVRFRYEHLNKESQHLGWLDGSMEAASISHNSLATIQRTASFTMVDHGDVNWLSDRIRPWFRLKMPDGGWAEWPLGLFLLSTPMRSIVGTGIRREVEAYDQTVILKDHRTTGRYTVTQGTNAIDAVRDLLVDSGIQKHALVSTDETFARDHDWEPGTERLEMVNDILGWLNYSPIYFNSAGAAVARPYESPSDRSVGYTYRTDDKSVLFPEVDQELDLFSVANHWLLVVSEPDAAPMSASYTNDDPSSPTSTVNRGRTITDFRESQEATSQAALDAKAKRLAEYASQVYEAVEISTALMPHHESSEVIQLDYPEVGAKTKYSEHKWSMNLKAGAAMDHRLRRVVNV